MQISRKFCFLVLLVLLLQMHLVRFFKNASFKYCQVNWWKHELLNKILEIKFYRNKITFTLALMAKRSEATCNLSTDYSHQRTLVRIPAQDYDIDRSEIEILCRSLSLFHTLHLNSTHKKPTHNDSSFGSQIKHLNSYINLCNFFVNKLFIITEHKQKYLSMVSWPKKG